MMAENRGIVISLEASGGGGKSTEERINRGLKVTGEAIQKGDSTLLKSCLKQFVTLGAPANQVGQVLMECPIALLKDSGFGIKIQSEALGREITLGVDIGWGEVEALLKNGVDSEGLKAVLEARDLFGGVVVNEDDFKS